MSQTPGPERSREYHVAPRYLAGPTLSGDLALQPFIELGWRPTHDELGNIYIASPGHRIRVGYLLEREAGALWKITAHADPFDEPRWLVTFDDQTPTEIVRGFTDALAIAYTEGPPSYLHSQNSRSARHAAGAPLEEAGWNRHDSGRGEVTYCSPDSLAQVRLSHHYLTPRAEITGQEERWLMGGGGPATRWFATASSRTPEPLVASMNKAIVDPTPVIRHGEDLHRLPPEATITPVRQVPADSHRTQAANARSTATPRRPPTIPPQRSAPPPEPPSPGRSR